MTASEHGGPEGDEGGRVLPSPADSVPDPLIGLLLDGRYRIERRLAQGGMATVYVARDERLERPVALKVMHPHLAESRDFVERFKREARAAARIVHPGVVSVFDQGVVHGQGFLVMELVDGPSLRALLRAQGAFTVSQALRYTQEILDALRAAHRVGVIHRDIKPENVLVPSEGPVQVADFGLARAASEVSLSSGGTALGTVAYMAPEAASGVADARTDIYSVGIMLDEMLLGHVPWEGEFGLQMLLSHVNEDVPPPSDEQRWIPREVDDLVAALTARDPEERPADAREALELVARVRASLPGDVANRRAEVHAAPTDGVPTASLPFTGATSPLPAPLTRTSQSVVHASGAHHVATSTRRRSRAGTVVALLLVVVLCATAGGYWWWSQYGPGSYLEMPVTVGRSAAAVRSELTAMGLTSTLTPAFSDEVPSGDVISSQPEGRQPVHKDAEVSLTVSKGVDMRTVPEVTGSTRDGASAALQDVGLTLGTVTEEYSETVAQGAVISQGSETGTQLRHGSAVDVVISKGREPLPVPDLAGKTSEQAKKAVTDLGLVPEETAAHSDTVAEGSVISQSTPAGSTAHRGDTVTYVVSLGPEMVEVPGVVGKQEDEATKILEDAGFQVRTERILGGYFATVRATDPAAGTSARKGSTVTITVV